MRNRHIRHLARQTGTLLLLLLGVGCISPAVHRGVPAFADAVVLATENSKSAFTVVEQRYEDVQAAKIVVNYEKNGFNPNTVTRFLEPEELETRLTLLDALQRYASTLAEVSSDQKLDEFDDKTRALGTAVQALTTTTAFQKLANSSGTNTNIAVTAVTALGHWFIERKRQQHLPELIEQMQGPVRTTAELLRADIGSPPDSQGHGGHGLRDQLWNEYTQALVQQIAFIDQNKEHMDPISRAAEIRKLPALVRQRSVADQTLRQTQSTLNELVDAHAELLVAAKSKASLHSAFDGLIVEAQRLKGFYDSLQSQE